MDYLLNEAPGGFLSIAANGTILMVNRTLAGWLASTPEQLQGEPMRSILSIGGRVFYETHFWPQLKLQGEIEEIYFSLRAKNGNSVPVLANAARRERNGEAVYDCVFLRMKQRDRYESDLILAKKEAERANQAKADFLSMMSHELRTPLNSIRGYTDILASEMDSSFSAEQLEDLACIRRGSDQLLHLIDDLLNFARMDREQLEVALSNVDVRDAIEEAESLMMPRLQEQGLKYHCEKFEEGLAVRADPNRLQQILLNLLTNAIKFTPSGGTVSTSCLQLENEVHFVVRDTGCGIPEDQLPRIFEPFVQVDRMQVEAAQRGVGLGLAISRKLARAMGGELTVQSTVGEGSAFTLVLRGCQLEDE
jgi:PAS domain S-box-containing protein